MKNICKCMVRGLCGYPELMFLSNLEETVIYSISKGKYVPLLHSGCLLFAKFSCPSKMRSFN